MSNISSDMNKEHTYKDIAGWEGNWELIDGTPYLLASPSYKHQFIVGELFAELRSFFRNKGCSVIVAPFDIQFDSNQEQRDSKEHVQPDISVVCEKNKITDSRVLGSPDLIIEVLSPSSALKDRNQKYNQYQHFGVKEYWVVDPAHLTIEVFGLQDGIYKKRAVFGTEDMLVSFEFPELQIKLKDILISEGT